MRRVEEMKKIMEKQMLEELERQRQAELENRKLKEVGIANFDSIVSPARIVSTHKGIAFNFIK